jgi:hypothetical protein
MTDIIINKSEFCKIMKQIKEQHQSMQEFSNALNKVCDGFVLFDSDNKYLDALLFVLNKIFNLKDSNCGTTLEWYLFEGTGDNKQDHKIWFENYEVNIDTDEKLYDLLITEKINTETNNIEPTREFFTKYGIKKEEVE